VLAFGGREGERLLQPNRGGNRFVNQAVQRSRADRLDHRISLGRRRSDMPRREPVVGIEQVHYPSMP
jgi:hypothetical protein